MSPTLVVIGAINVDLVVTGERLPGPGETVTGGRFATHHGGKGGNQAVAAARALGSAGRVVMVGRVGDDDLGAGAVQALTEVGVVAAVEASPDTPTGVALIVVNRSGENQIAVAPGANALVDAPQVERALDEHRPGVVLASLEVPREAIVAAGGWCGRRGVPLVLNPAPTRSWLGQVVGSAAYLTPNETELAALGDVPAGVMVVETRGSKGVRIHGPTPRDLAAPAVEAVDTTGAGDAFNGVFAAGLLEGLDAEAAARRGVVAAALATSEPGAREGMPTRARIEAARMEGR